MAFLKYLNHHRPIKIEVYFNQEEKNLVLMMEKNLNVQQERNLVVGLRDYQIFHILTFRKQEI